MRTPIMAGVLAFLFFVGGVKAGLFDKVSPPDQNVKDLEGLLELVEIVDTGDINSDGIDDYIIKYKDSASGYGEFLFNVIISDGAGYWRGFIYDLYFVELSFKGCALVGINREGGADYSVKKYIFNVQEKSMEETSALVKTK